MVWTFPISKVYRDLSYPQKKSVVQQLARHFVDSEISAVSAPQAEKVVREVLATMRSSSAAAARAVLQSLVERSGILREKAPGLIDFIHNTFKEFLAAETFITENDAAGLARHVESPGWENVLLFAAAGSRHPGFTSNLIRNVLGGRRRETRPQKQARAASQSISRRPLVAAQLAAVAQRIEPALAAELKKQTANLRRPQTMSEAVGLAQLGNEATKFLRYQAKLSIREAAASVRTLRLLGTPEARTLLVEYAKEERLSVIGELAQAINPLEIKEVIKRIVGSGDLSENIRRHIRDLSPLRVRSEIQRIDLSGTGVTDLSPLAGLSRLTSLDLGYTGVTDVSPLAGLSGLISLDLRGTGVTDVSPGRPWDQD